MMHPLAPEQRQISGRDLAWLIASLLVVMAPHALRAPWWLTLLTLCLYGWRMYFALNRGPLPARWLVLGVAAVAMLGVWVEFRTLFGRQPGILLLMLFSGLKLLETRTHRDGAMAAFLGYFLVITNFLYAQTIPTRGRDVRRLFLLTATLVRLAAPQRAARQPAHRRHAARARRPGGARALSAFPPRAGAALGPAAGCVRRHDGPLGHDEPGDAVQPGDVGCDRISRRVPGRLAAAALRYWRGPVLGLRRPQLEHRAELPGRLRAAARRNCLVPLRVVLEPHNRHWLFALETAASLPAGGARMSHDGQIVRARRAHAHAL